MSVKPFLNDSVVIVFITMLLNLTPYKSQCELITFFYDILHESCKGDVEHAFVKFIIIINCLP